MKRQSNDYEAELFVRGIKDTIIEWYVARAKEYVRLYFQEKFRDDGLHYWLLQGTWSGITLRMRYAAGVAARGTQYDFTFLGQARLINEAE